MFFWKFSRVLQEELFCRIPPGGFFSSLESTLVAILLPFWILQCFLNTFHFLKLVAINGEKPLRWGLERR